LCYLHENHIRHKDVKPENVLVKGHTVYLTDFGISLDWTESGHSTTSGYTILTRRYCAPEVANFVKRNSSSDIWSLGCIFLEIWTVVKGKTVDALIAYLENAASHSTCYHQNLSAVQNWCSTIKNSSGGPADNVPLEWIDKMLQQDQSERCAARTLCEYIQEANADPENKFRFSGDCCIDDDEPESEPSLTETAITLTQTAGSYKALSTVDNTAPNDNIKSSDNVFPSDEHDLGSVSLGMPQTILKAQIPKIQSRVLPRRNTNQARSSSQLTLQQYFSPRHNSSPVPVPLTPSHHRITGSAKTSVPGFAQLTMSPSRSSRPKVETVEGTSLNSTLPASSHKRKAESIENPAVDPSLLIPSSSRKKQNSMSKHTPTANHADLGLDPLPDALAPSLICIFVGVNPSIKTATTGHAYAHPSNLFWKLLHSSGCTTRRCLPKEDQDMPRLFALGLTNLVQRPTRDAAQLTNDEMDNKVDFLVEKIRRYRPESVCLVGKGIWECIWRVKHGRKIRKEEFHYGWQDESERMGAIKASMYTAGRGETPPWSGAMVFVATSTSGQAGSTSLDEKEAIWRELGEWVKRRREERR
jgi:thymine-DNA glycosylase